MDNEISRPLMKLILGSRSQGRQDVLKRAGYDFDIVTADIDEKTIRDNDPEKLVLALAHAKADAILPKITEMALLITADQVVVCNGRIMEKPKDQEEAREFVRCYVTHPMEAINGMVVTNTKTGKRADGIDIAKVYFRAIPEEVIDQALVDGRIMHCAGAMRCEDEPFNKYVENFIGTRDSTSGLPLQLLTRLMNEVQDGQHDF